MDTKLAAHLGLARFIMERSVQAEQEISIAFSRRRSAIPRLGFCVNTLGFKLTREG
jgi:hypothetical protein